MSGVVMRMLCVWMMIIDYFSTCGGVAESDGGGEAKTEAAKTSNDGLSESSSNGPASVSQRAAAQSNQLIPVTGKSEAFQSRTQSELTTAQIATLQAADISDGVEDNVISDCSRCAMMMPGDAEHASHVGDYELHFCAAGCKAKFEADLDKGIAEIQNFLDES